MADHSTAFMCTWGRNKSNHCYTKICNHRTARESAKYMIKIVGKGEALQFCDTNLYCNSLNLIDLYPFPQKKCYNQLKIIAWPELKMEIGTVGKLICEMWRTTCTGRLNGTCVCRSCKPGEEGYGSQYGSHCNRWDTPQHLQIPCQSCFSIS